MSATVPDPAATWKQFLCGCGHKHFRWSCKDSTETVQLGCMLLTHLQPYGSHSSIGWSSTSGTMAGCMFCGQPKGLSRYVMSCESCGTVQTRCSAVCNPGNIAASASGNTTQRPRGCSCCRLASCQGCCQCCCCGCSRCWL